ncbi:MAG: CPBP family intramembrane glutamic endopeptidase, partial [Lysinibacillus sp.]
FFDELPTWQYVLHGIGYGTLLYGLIRAGHELLRLFIPTIDQTIAIFLKTYGPTNIWHYTILVFIIVIGEEMFWRGYVQQQLKKVVPILQAVLISSLLFSISLLIIGFIPGAISALLAGVIFGMLYEWKKSLPLIIVAHAVFVILLFLVLPLPL